MLALLPQTFREVATLPGEQQEAFAKWVIDELVDVDDWRVALDRSLNKLAEFRSDSRRFDPISTREPRDNHALH